MYSTQVNATIPIKNMVTVIPIDNDVWVMKDAGPWGMVKMVSKEGTTAVLTKSYTDAKDMLTGPVTTFPGMPK